MKTIAEQLIQLNQIKSDIKQAIIDKGVPVSNDDGFATYASKISAISGGGVQPVPEGIRFSNSTFYALPDLLQNGLDWGGVSSMLGIFASCGNLTEVVLSGLSNVTTMQTCFQWCTSIKNISLDGLSKLKNLSSCFHQCTSLTTLTLSDLSVLENLSYTFNSCNKLESIVLSGLNHVKTMLKCFNGCRSLSSVTLSGLHEVSSMSDCFSGCTSLQHLSVDSWGTVITDLTSWRISVCTGLTHDSLLNLINALYTTNVTRTCTIGTTNLAKLSAEEIAIATNKGWTLN